MGKIDNIGCGISRKVLRSRTIFGHFICTVVGLLFAPLSVCLSLSPISRAACVAPVQFLPGGFIEPARRPRRQKVGKRALPASGPAPKRLGFQYLGKLTQGQMLNVLVFKCQSDSPLRLTTPGVHKNGGKGTNLYSSAFGKTPPPQRAEARRRLALPLPVKFPRTPSKILRAHP